MLATILRNSFFGSSLPKILRFETFKTFRVTLTVVEVVRHPSLFILSLLISGKPFLWIAIEFNRLPPDLDKRNYKQQNTHPNTCKPHNRYQQRHKNPANENDAFSRQYHLPVILNNCRFLSLARHPVFVIWIGMFGPDVLTMRASAISALGIPITIKIRILFHFH